jgi:hypothetical protein
MLEGLKAVERNVEIECKGFACEEEGRLKVCLL